MSMATIYSPLGNRSLVITNYSIGFTGVNSVVQGRFQSFVYPIRMRQDPFKFTIQCRNEAEKEGLIKFIRRHQVVSVIAGSVSKSAYTGQLRFFWFQEKLDFLGYIKGVNGGAVRFQQAPTLQLEMLLIKDFVYSQSNKVSSGADWTGVYDGEVALNPPGSVTGWHWVDDSNGGHWAPGPAPLLPTPDVPVEPPNQPGPGGYVP